MEDEWFFSPLPLLLNIGLATTVSDKRDATRMRMMKCDVSSGNDKSKKIIQLMDQMIKIDFLKKMMELCW